MSHQTFERFIWVNKRSKKFEKLAMVILLSPYLGRIDVLNNLSYLLEKEFKKRPRSHATDPKRFNTEGEKFQMGGGLKCKIGFEHLE